MCLHINYKPMSMVIQERMQRKQKIYNFALGRGTFAEGSVQQPSLWKKEPPLVSYAYRSHVFSMILFVLVCKTHNKILLKRLKAYQVPMAKSGQAVYFFPTHPVDARESYAKAMNQGLKAITTECCSVSEGNVVRMDIVHLHQIRVIRFSELISQYTVAVELGQCVCSQSICTAEYRWFALNQLQVERSDLFANDLSSRLATFNATRCSEFSIKFVCKLYQSKWHPLLSSVEMSHSIVAQIFDDFQQQCFPSLTMNRIMFYDYLQRHNMNIVVNGDQSDVARLYNAFCGHKNFITFVDLLFTMVALDSKCPHRSAGAELRARSIFRYYSSPGSAFITNDQFEALLGDIQKLDKKKLTETVASKLEKLHKKANIPMDQPIDMDSFLELVGSLEIRGTSNLLRSNISTIDCLTVRKLYSFLSLRPAQRQGNEYKEVCRAKVNMCGNCGRKVYRIAIHSLSMNQKNHMIAAQQMTMDTMKLVPRHMRVISYERINAKSYLNEIPTILRRFARLKFGLSHMQVDDTCLKWERADDRMKLVPKIQIILKGAMDHFRAKPRVVRTQSPIYIFGDVHGNFKDLMVYDRLFWRTAPSGYLVTCLFLGDYVDRGESSIECVLYLLCLLLQRPESIFMLRGNHEFRPIQQQFTFFRECCNKFDAEGASLWESFNNVFDNLPLSAVVDEQVYCAHGGITTTVTRVENCEEIPVPLPNPHLDSKLAWEALWNDPISPSEYSEFLALLPNDKCVDCPRGFLPNMKRGTAFYYSEDAVDTFLEQNNLSFIIRGHEVIQPGFQLHMDGKVITVFSCSNYCGADNEAAVIYLEASKLRVMKIDTNNIK